MNQMVQLLRDDADHLEDFVGIAPLIVIPRNEFDEGRVEGDAGFGVEDRGLSFATEVCADDFLIGVAEDAFERAFGGGFDGSADFLVGGWLVELDGEVNNRDIGGWNAECHSGEFFVESRNDLAHGLGGAGRGWDDILENATSTAPIFAARAVNGFLRGCGSVNSSHETALDTEGVVDDFRERRKAVCGAARIRDDGLASVGGMVHAVDEHRSLVFGRRRHDDFFGAGLEMRFSTGFVEKEACGFHHDVGTDFVPFQSGWIFDGSEADFVAVYDEVIALDRDFAFETTVNRVVFEHVSEILGFKKIVDADNLNVLAEIFDRCTEDHSPDASEAVDTDFYHDVFFRVGLMFQQGWEHLRESMRQRQSRNGLRIPNEECARRKIQLPCEIEAF